MLAHFLVLAVLTDVIGRSSVCIYGPTSAFYVFKVAQAFKGGFARRVVKIVCVCRKLEALPLPENIQVP